VRVLMDISAAMTSAIGLVIASRDVIVVAAAAAANIGDCDVGL